MDGDDSTSLAEHRATRFIRRFELVIVGLLVFQLIVVVSVATVELGWLLLRDLRPTGELLIDEEGFFTLFGFFLLVLIGVELLTILKTFWMRGSIHGEVVIEVALIAVAQKVIVLDTSRASPWSLLALAALIVALAAAFWWVRSAWQRAPGP
jgi:uncharacterized membrane protein (DUF373 family)